MNVHPLSHGRGGDRLFVLVLHYDAERRRRVEGDPAGQEVVKDDPHRVEVAPRVERLATPLLRRHVLGRADD
jgi:hypothetical protein